MLVECKNCHVSFDRSFGNCIVCGTEVSLSTEEKYQLCVLEAKELLSRGENTKQVLKTLSYLMSLPKPEVKRAIDEAKGYRRDASRRLGIQIMGVGLLFSLGAFGIFCLSMGYVISLKYTAIGLVFFCVGLLKVLTGWNLTGRDEG